MMSTASWCGLLKFARQNPLSVHGRFAHGQHGLFRKMTEKLRPFREIRVQKVFTRDFVKTLIIEQIISLMLVC